MTTGTCPNCGVALPAHQKYCSECGQKTNLPRITIRYFIREFVLFFTHADKGLFNLFKGLVIRPGQTASEYIDGKRKVYFNPFGFLALCVAFMLFVSQWLQPYPDPPSPDPVLMANMPDDYLRTLYVDTVERTAQFQNFFNKNMNLLLIFATPFFAVFLWIFFRSRGRNIAEINVAYLLFTGFSTVASSILFSPILASVRNTSSYYIVFWTISFIQTAYFAWGLQGVFNFYSASGFFRVLGTLLLIGLIGFVILFTGLFIYVYGGENFQVLRWL